MEFHRILVPTDLSEYSRRALEPAKRLAEAFGGKIDLLYVETPEFDFAAVPGLEEFPSVSLEEVHSLRHKSTEQLLSELWEKIPARLRGETVIRSGTPFLEIVRYARERETDLIVLTTHGRTGLKYMIMGSVAEKVVRKAPCAVLTIKVKELSFEYP